MKKIFSWMMAVFIVAFAGFSSSSFLASVLVENTNKDITPKKENGQQSTQNPPLTLLDIDCKNGRNNRFWKEMLDDQGRPSKYKDTVKKFLEEQDTFFAERRAVLSGTDITCDLSNLEEESAVAALQIQPIASFRQERLANLQDLNCALIEAEYDDLPCEEGVLLLTEAQNCKRKPKEDIRRIRADIKESVYIALDQEVEGATPWPLHKRLECINQQIAEQRKILVEILDIYTEVASSYPNSAQST